MAYKFQFGPAVMSGSLEQEGTVDIRSDGGAGSGVLKIAGSILSDAARNVTATSLSSSAGLTAGGALIVGGTVKLDGVVDTAMVDADDLFFRDSDGLVKRERASDVRDLYFSAVSGDATVAAGGALAIAVGAVVEGKLANGAVSLGKMAGLSRGSLIFGNAAGAPANLAKGTANKFLQSDGTDIDWIALSGDATLSAGALTIASGAVSPAKMANMAANTVLVRDAGDAGVPSAKAVADTQLLIGDGTGFTAAALSGDVTMTNAGAVTIANNAVSLAKMAGLARGSIIHGNPSGDPSALGKGGANTFLQSDGTDVAYVAMSGDATLSAGAISIGATRVTDAMLNDDCATGLAGVGLVAASGVLALSLDELSDAQAIAVASDSIAFIDANDSNISKKESIVDFIAAIAGGGLSANAGVLSTQGGVATAIGDVATATLVEGMNYGSATLGQNSVWSLPATPSVGDIVHAKAPANLGGFTLKIARQGTHTIDGVLELSLETAQAAVTVMYVAANTWVLF